jgi:hypothetical protein
MNKKKKKSWQNKRLRRLDYFSKIIKKRQKSEKDDLLLHIKNIKKTIIYKKIHISSSSLFFLTSFYFRLDLKIRWLGFYFFYSVNNL